MPQNDSSTSLGGFAVPVDVKVSLSTSSFVYLGLVVVGSVVLGGVILRFLPR